MGCGTVLDEAKGASTRLNEGTRRVSGIRDYKQHVVQIELFFF